MADEPSTDELPEAVRQHEEIVRQMLRARCVP